MKVIFLDFDGVINNVELWGTTKFLPKALRSIERIVESTGAIVVASTAWRRGHSVQELNGFVKDNGGKFEIVDKTPAFYRQIRGVEIQAWLEDHPGAESFVILDDMDECQFVGLEKNLVRTDDTVGLTSKNADRAIEILGPTKSC